MYREQQKLKYQLEHERYDKERLRRQNHELEKEKSNLNNTEFNGLVALLKNIFSLRTNVKNIH